MSENWGLVGSCKEAVGYRISCKERNFVTGFVTGYYRISCNEQRLKKWLNYSLFYSYIYKYIGSLQDIGLPPLFCEKWGIPHLYKLLTTLRGIKTDTPNPVTKSYNENLQVVVSDYR